MFTSAPSCVLLVHYTSDCATGLHEFSLVGFWNTPKSPGAVTPVLCTKKTVRKHHRSVLVLSSDALESTS